MKKLFTLLLLLVVLQCYSRDKINFNGNWLLQVGDVTGAEASDYNDGGWEKVTLPHAFNEAEAFKVSIENLTDTVMWYRKHFTPSESLAGKKVFLEMEGVRFGADIYLNGKKVGYTENGVMASGYDLTPYIKEGENVLAVRVDNSWNYRERSSGSRYQWNDKNFNANYGGIPKNVWLHVTGRLYQTLPLYSNLGTTGVYIYGKDFNIKAKTMTLHAESQVHNDYPSPQSFQYTVDVYDAKENKIAHFDGGNYTLQPGETKTVSLEGTLSNVHFWSWGYGYLYKVVTSAGSDDVVTRTGFRKTKFGEGKFWLNDRELMIHGYAQRTSNEWPGVGIDIPSWLSDYSNHLQVESNGNLVRWMHVTPSKQDVESCDRVGLLEAMPAGDAEHDVDGRRWEQRKLLMRDAIIYNRNNPSIVFIECGNESISRQHMKEMRSIRDEYDPFGGRAIGSREMLDIEEAEYGGEMLYVNKSAGKPYWAMEYNRDEGLRKYWDNWSYPYHQEGDGPLYRGKPALEYNHNMDEFARTMVDRWYDFYQERPGTGKRVSNGGVKIVFSDTNTHHRGEANYRTSGVVDAMRIPKEAFYVHQVMWNGWVTPEKDSSYIVGHWIYKPGTVLRKYVVSTGDKVQLFINGKSAGYGKRSSHFLFTFDSLSYQPGIIEAVSYRNGKIINRVSKETIDGKAHLKITPVLNPQGFKADGADIAILQVEAVDKKGRRLPLDNTMLHFNVWGEARFLGGIGVKNRKTRKAEKKDGLLDAASTDNLSDNYIRSIDLPLEGGINRVLIRSTVNPGNVYVTVGAEGYQPVSAMLKTEKVDIEKYHPQMTLPCRLERGETPLTPSYQNVKRTIEIAKAEAGSNAPDATKSFDDNELSEWKSDGKKENAWITYHLKEKTAVDEITLKLAGWRNKMYPLAVYEDGKNVWQGYTYPSLGYVHIRIDKPVNAKKLTIKMLGPAKTHNESGDTKELAGGKAGEFDQVSSAKGRIDLRIVEIDLLQNL